MSSLGKRPVQVRKDVGFLGNRIQGALMREALWLIEQGVASPEDVDATVRLSFGFRYAAAGPIMQKEHSGWDDASIAPERARYERALRKCLEIFREEGIL